MNKFFTEENQIRQIPYRMGNKYNNTQYVYIGKNDLAYMRYMYSLLWGHVKLNKDNGEFGRHMYYKMFVEYDDVLPKPTKLGKQHKNTWATFLQGVEHNFLFNGTNDLTVKQLPHVVYAVNLAVEYFTVGYPDFEASDNVHKIEMFRT